LPSNGVPIVRLLVFTYGNGKTVTEKKTVKQNYALR
jgi:hypothetical protein